MHLSSIFTPRAHFPPSTYSIHNPRTGIARHQVAPTKKLATQLAPVNPWWNEAGRRVTLAQKWHETQPLSHSRLMFCFALMSVVSLEGYRTEAQAERRLWPRATHGTFCPNEANRSASSKTQNASAVSFFNFHRYFCRGVVRGSSTARRLQHLVWRLPLTPIRRRRSRQARERAGVLRMRLPSKRTLEM